jgi:hypothetical protein
MAAQMEARGLAVLKDASGADRKADQALHLLDRAAGHWEDEPPWLYFYQGPWMQLQIGALQLDLGRRARAVDLLSDALATLDPAYVRDAAWYRAILARAQFESGDADQAAATALEALPDAKAMNAYALEHLVVTARRLHQRAPSVPGVANLVASVSPPTRT